MLIELSYYERGGSLRSLFINPAHVHSFVHRTYTDGTGGVDSEGGVLQIGVLAYPIDGDSAKKLLEVMIPSFLIPSGSPL